MVVGFYIYFNIYSSIFGIQHEALHYEDLDSPTQVQTKSLHACQTRYRNRMHDQLLAIYFHLANKVDELIAGEIQEGAGNHNTKCRD